MIVATCTGVDFPLLELYAQQLLAWRKDPLETIQPEVPIVFPAKGNARLYAAQARKDHPELEQVPTFPTLEFVADVLPGRVRYTTLGRVRKVSREEAMKLFGVYTRSARRI